MAKTNTREKLLAKKDVFRAWAEWCWWYLALINMERLQSPAVIRMLGVLREKLYPGDSAKQKELLMRHQPFFNTEPFWGGPIIMGITLGMEEQKALGDDVPDDLITGIKTSLMGPLAGIGDALFQATMIPILGAIAIGLSSETGSISGPLFYIIAIWAIVPFTSWYLFNTGYHAGISAVEEILSSGIKDKIVQAANIVGLFVSGAVSAQIVKVSTGLTYRSGEFVVSLQDNLNDLFPKLLSLLAVFATYYLMVKKKISVNTVLLIFFVVSIIGYFTTILAVP